MIYIICGLFILLDMLSGILKAFKEKNYTSSIMREGLFHKCGSILCVVFGALVEYSQSYIDLGVTIPVAGAICTYICIMEMGSIIENVGAINPNIMPDKIMQYFEKLKKK